jgi:hypothetical protein
VVDLICGTVTPILVLVWKVPTLIIRIKQRRWGDAGVAFLWLIIVGQMLLTEYAFPVQQLSHDTQGIASSWTWARPLLFWTTLLSIGLLGLVGWRRQQAPHDNNSGRENMRG